MITTQTLDTLQQPSISLMHSALSQSATSTV